MTLARVVPSGAVLVALAAIACGCGPSSSGPGKRELAAAAGVTSQTSAPTSGAPTAPGASPAPAPAPAPAAPATGTGSRFWYLNDTYGNPFKVHDATEAGFVAQVLTLLNQERARAGVPPLQADAQAERAAKVHCEDMTGRAFFDHVTPEGWTPEDRLRMTGASGYVLVGENIAVGQRSPADVMAAWYASPGHRANMLDPRFTHVGIGFDAPGVYWAQVFLRR